MKTAITAGLDKDAKKDMEAAFKSSSFLRERLQEILDKRIKENRDKTISEDTFKDPNWALHQAYLNGLEAGLEAAKGYLKD